MNRLAGACKQSRPRYPIDWDRLDFIGREITHLIETSRDPWEVDRLIRAKARINRMKAEYDRTR